VANFLAYVNASPGAYTNNLVHRSEPGFVIQAGGYQYVGSMQLKDVPANAKVNNEPVYSNVRGTIAMAKLDSDANSATNQWFINLADNSANLDKQNGGFTAFGQITGGGMAVVDAIAALNRFNLGAGFTAVPLRNYTTADANAGTPPGENNLVLIRNVIVLDANPDSAASLNPAKNTLISAPPPSGGIGDSSSGGGGSMGLVGLFALGLLALRRKAALQG
jgi:cyclophilin family peptidyl-prolyl cis-trans isomerase